jgi:hypothetical protein
MGSVGVYANVVNKVFDVLEAARATGQPLERVNGILFGERDRVSSLLHPYLKVVLEDPPIDEEWTAGRNQRGGEFRIIIGAAGKYEISDRPYGRIGGPAVTNLLLWSEAFDDATWVKAFVVITPNDPSISPPDGDAGKADVFTENVGPNLKSTVQSFDFISDGNYSMSLYCKPLGRDWIAIDIRLGTGDRVRQSFNIATGTVGTTSQSGTGVAFVSASAEAIDPAGAWGSGWYRIKLTVDITGFGAGGQARLFMASADDTIFYTGDGRDCTLIRGIQVEAGSTIHRYILSEGTQGVGPDPARVDGILLLMEDVMNVLDSNHDAILASSSGAIDMSLTGRAFRPIGDDVYGGEIVARFRTRFLSAGR